MYPKIKYGKSKPNIFQGLIDIWVYFWYKCESPNRPRLGGGPQGYLVFRKQRLINVIILLFMFLLLYLYLK